MKQRQKKVFIISGPGGVGKATIIKGVLESGKYNLVRGMNVTTRHPRPSDKKDPHFTFVSKQEFKKMISQDEILEHNYLDGEYYGTNGPSLQEQLKKHNVLIEVDVNGAAGIVKAINNVVLIFVTADFKNIEKRIRGRGEDSAHHIHYRLELAKKEMKKADEYDCIVNNPEGHPEVAVNEVLSIIAKELQKKE
jgi:guanylate kinase